VVRILKEIVREWGDAHDISPTLMKAVAKDFFKNKETSFRQKCWAYKRGFISSRIKAFGLTEENYREYLPDFAYYRFEPNGRFRMWIDDKLTMKYILHPFAEYLPKYYFHLTKEAGSPQIIRLMDCRTDFAEDLDGIVGLLKAERVLAVKRISGFRGKGFYKLSCHQDQYFVNEKQLNRDELLIFLNGLNDYILTEYLAAHRNLRKIWDQTPNTIRLLTLKNKSAPPQIIASFIRFGRLGSGPVENIDPGTLGAHIDIATGHFSNGFEGIKNGYAECKLHPDTQIPLEGDVPYWEDMKKTVLAVCSYLPQLRFLGFDLVATDDGYRIIEINSAPAIGALCYLLPTHMKDSLQDFFTTLSKEKQGEKAIKRQP